MCPRAVARRLHCGIPYAILCAGLSSCANDGPVPADDRAGNPGAEAAGSRAGSAISRTFLVEVGDVDGPGQVYEQGRVFWDEADRILITAPQSEGVIKIFDHSGTFQQSVGRTGTGPGEYQSPTFIERYGEDGYRVFDPGLRRVTLLTSGFELVGTNALGANAADYATLTDGTVIATFISRNPAVFIHPFHRLNGDGSEIIKSFGGSTEGNAPVNGFSVMRKISPSMGKPAFWSASLNRYRLEEWSGGGELLETFEHAPDWFQPWIGPMESPLETAPLPSIAGIQEDSTGMVWVLIHVAAEDWQPMPPARMEGGEAYRSHAQDNLLFDTVIEVVDPVSDEVIASSRVDGAVRGFAGPGIVYSYAEDAIGNPSYRLDRVDLVLR